MNLKTFTRFIEGLEKYQDKRDKAYKLGIDILDFDQDYYREVIRPLMSEVFTEEGMDWINWYLYDRPSLSGGKDLEAFDKDSKPICFDIPSLYDTIKEYLK
jgi:hypothetical protein